MIVELKRLLRAVQFLDICRVEREAAKATGAMKDAHEELERAARLVAHAFQVLSETQKEELP